MNKSSYALRENTFNQRSGAERKIYNTPSKLCTPAEIKRGDILKRIERITELRGTGLKPEDLQ